MRARPRQDKTKVARHRRPAAQDERRRRATWPDGTGPQHGPPATARGGAVQGADRAGMPREGHGDRGMLATVPLGSGALSSGFGFVPDARRAGMLAPPA